ncbi:ABC transporter ATP-binding protein [Marinilactibacillus kalidii]|uniref:ABC transporter ATP-binding protein n=1 Tax=Marinilactibacillus kalidii TaxID=2820274 RepID=UPI001ABE27CA|nr:ABC transporter ATP-binding protein [Marinilactibacillus kalidii]
MKEKWQNLIKLIKMMVSYRPRIFLTIIGIVLIQVLLPVIQLYLSVQVIEWLINEEEIQTYLIHLAIFIGVITLLKISEHQFGVTVDKDTELFRNYAKTRLISNFVSLDYPLLIGKEAQEKYNNAVALTWNPWTLFGRVNKELVSLGSTFLGLIIYSSILIQLDSIFLIYLGIFIFFVTLFNIFQVKMDQKIYDEKAKVTKKWQYLRKLYGESRLAKDVRIFQMQHWFQRTEEETDQTYLATMKPKVWLTWSESVVINVGIIGLTAFSYSQSVRLVSEGAIPISNFVLYAGMVTILAQSILEFINVVGKFSTSLNEMGKFNTFMAQEPVFLHGEGEKVPKESLNIELKNVTYTYPNNEAPTIRNINLQIRPNEKLAIVGENGAGKSTLTNLISGLLQPDEGEILINYLPQKSFNILDYYSLFASVFQEKLLLTYTIKETIIQGLPFDQKKYEKTIALSGLKKLISQLQKGDETAIVKEVNADAIQLSGGQLQKVKLAQALYKDTPVLILDEPTAALDPIAEHQIYKDYFKFSKDKTSLFVSHRLSSTRFCDRIIYLKDGEIAEIGTHQELIEKQGDYYRLYEAQSYYYKQDKDSEQRERVTGGGTL